MKITYKKGISDINSFLKHNYPKIKLESITDSIMAEYLLCKRMTIDELKLFLTTTGLMKKEVEKITLNDIDETDKKFFITVDKKLNKTNKKRVFENDKPIVVKTKATIAKRRKVEVLFHNKAELEAFKVLLLKINEVKKKNEVIFDKGLTQQIKNYQKFRTDYAQRYYKNQVEERFSNGTLELDFKYNGKYYDAEILTQSMGAIDFLLNEDRYSKKKMKSFIDIILFNKNFLVEEDYT